MDINSILAKVKEARELGKKRKFTQTFDCIINLQNLDLRKPEHKLDLGVTLACPVRDKKFRVCAIVDQGITGADKFVDKVLGAQDLQALKGNIKEIRKITHGYDKFIVQVNLMPAFAQVLGRYLGPMNKMPSPKLGMVINPKTDIAALVGQLQKMALLQTKKNLVLQCSLGSEKESDETIAKNLAHVYEVLVGVLPGQKNNLKSVYVKMTMSKPLEVDL